MDITEDGMIISVKLAHPWNALSPIEVTKDGMVMFVKLAQEINE